MLLDNGWAKSSTSICFHLLGFHILHGEKPNHINDFAYHYKTRCSKYSVRVNCITPKKITKKEHWPYVAYAVFKITYAESLVEI